MARAYSSSVVALAISADLKWLDNLLTHNNIAGVSKTRQGVPRRLTPDSVATIWVAKIIVDQLGASSPTALQVAQTVLRNGIVEVGVGLRIVADRNAIDSLLSQRLLDAVQTSPSKARGRPPKQRRPAIDADLGESL